MERRIRLAWSPEHLRSWCQGASLPPAPAAEEPSLAQAPTAFLRVQRLMEKIRQRRGARALPPEPASPHGPAAPLPQAPPSLCDVVSASDADTLPSARDAAR